MKITVNCIGVWCFNVKSFLNAPAVYKRLTSTLIIIINETTYFVFYGWLYGFYCKQSYGNCSSFWTCKSEQFFCHFLTHCSTEELPCYNLCHAMRNLQAYWKTKAQISCTVTAQLISTFVLATELVQSLYFLNSNF